MGNDHALFLQGGMLLTYCSIYHLHPENDTLVLVRQMPHPYFHISPASPLNLFYFQSWQRRFEYPPLQRLYRDLRQLAVMYGEILHCHRCKIFRRSLKTSIPRVLKQYFFHIYDFFSF